MEKFKEMVKKELKNFEEQGVTSSNLQTISTLVDILKDLHEIEEDRGEYGMRYYPKEGSRNIYMPIYRDGYENPRMYDSYMDRYPMDDGRYRHTPMEYLFEKIARLCEHMEEYVEGKERYHAGAHPGHMSEGLEKTMYAVCTLVESLMDSAETPEEKETIRKHMEKIKHI